MLKDLMYQTIGVFLLSSVSVFAQEDDLKTNCAGEFFSGSAERQVTIPSDIKLNLFLTPEYDGFHGALQTDRSTTVEFSNLVEENGFACVAITGLSQKYFWIELSELQSVLHQEKGVTVVNSLSTEAFREAVQDCLPQNVDSNQVSKSIITLYMTLADYTGCSDPTQSYVISQDHEFETNLRILDILNRIHKEGSSGTCSSKVLRVTSSLSETMRQLRNEFPECGRANNLGMTHRVIARSGLNMREHWIEGVSAKIEGAIPNGARVELLDHVGDWGRYRLTNGAKTWMWREYTSPIE